MNFFLRTSAKPLRIFATQKNDTRQTQQKPQLPPHFANRKVQFALRILHACGGNSVVAGRQINAGQ